MKSRKEPTPHNQYITPLDLRPLTLQHHLNPIQGNSTRLEILKLPINLPLPLLRLHPACKINEDATTSVSTSTHTLSIPNFSLLAISSTVVRL